VEAVTAVQRAVDLARIMYEYALCCVMIFVYCILHSDNNVSISVEVHYTV